MNRYLESVKIFHETFGQAIHTQKDEINLMTRRLRLKLIFEELQEFAEASDLRATFFSLCHDVTLNELKENITDGDNRNRKEEIDSLIDLEYVLAGSVLSLGYADVFDDAFDEVHSSNMSKACKNLEEVNQTIDNYQSQGVESIYEKKPDGSYVVLRKVDGKVLKNTAYKKAELDKFINRD